MKRVLSLYYYNFHTTLLLLLLILCICKAFITLLQNFFHIIYCASEKVFNTVITGNSGRLRHPVPLNLGLFYS